MVPPDVTAHKRLTTAKTHLPPTLSRTYPTLQYSVHTPPRSLFHELPTIFPDLRSYPLPLNPLFVPIFQKARLDLLQFGDPEQQEKDRLLVSFLDWAGKLRAHVLSRGGEWVDITDPVTGCAYFGTSGAAYSDVDGIVRVLPYPTRDVGGCRIIKHPQWGFAVYPSTLFTTASLDIVLQALHVVNGADNVQVDDTVTTS